MFHYTIKASVLMNVCAWQEFAMELLCNMLLWLVYFIFCLPTMPEYSELQPCSVA